MDKLFVVLVIALFAICVLGQAEQNNNENDLEDRYGFNNNNQGNNRPGHRLPGNNRHPGHNRPGNNWNNGNNRNPENPQTTSTTTAAAPGFTTQSPELRQCLASCPTTSEYNPVCGTNGVTYDNPGRLACAQHCGVDVSLRRTSRCPA